MSAIRPSTQIMPEGSPLQVFRVNAAGTAVEAADPSGAPSGAAGGDLTGTYPNPTLDLTKPHTWTAEQTAPDFAVTGLTGATTATRYVGGTTTGHPTTGTFAVGDFVVTADGHVWICTAAGSPGTWVDASSGGSAQYVARDRLTASTGNQVLTLGATPVTNSPLIWKNGTPLWPVTDYTISSNVITFPSALTAGDIIADYYLTTNASPGAATLTNPSPPDVAGVQLTYAASASTIAVAFPSAAVAGQLCIIALASGFAPATTPPTGWTQVDRQTGSNVGGGIYSKVLSSGDISAGSVTFTMGGTYAIEAVAWAISNGTTVRTSQATRSSTGAASATVTTTGSATSGDLGLYFGLVRASSDTITFNRGTLESQRAADTNFGSGAAKETGLASGTVSVIVSHSVSGSGYYDGIVVIGP